MDMKRLYSYSIVRFISDPVRGEALNLGVIVVGDEKHEAASAFLPHFKTRLSLLDPWATPSIIERLIDTLSARVASYQPPIGGVNEMIVSSKDLQHLSSTMKNQLQVSEPRLYRASSLKAAVDELFADLVSPRRKPPSEAKGMSLQQLKGLIRATIRDWGGNFVKIEEGKLQRGSDARHYADFWIEYGTPQAAFIAIPDDPDERDIAWARRDSVPTIAEEFLRINPQFKAVVVFPPNGHTPPTEFVRETRGFLSDIAGVLVARADELQEHRGVIAPRIL